MKNRNTTNIGIRTVQHCPAAVIVLLLWLLSSCKRDELCYLHFDKAIVQVLVQYDTEESTPNVIYLGIYNADTGAFIREEVIEDPNTPHLVILGIGRYKFVVYNEPFVEGNPFAETSVDFASKNAWSDFCVFAKDDPAYRAGGRSSIRTTISITDNVMTDRMEEFEITKEMIARVHTRPTPKEERDHYLTIDTTLYFKPKYAFTKTNITLRVKHYTGWTFRRTNGNRPYLEGVADYFCLGTNTYSEQISAQFLEFVNGTPPVDKVTTFSSSSFMAGFAGGKTPNPNLLSEYILFLRFDYIGALGLEESKPLFISLSNGTGAKHVKTTFTKAGTPRLVDKKTFPYDVWDIEIDVELEERIPMGDGLDADLEDWENEDIQLNPPPMVLFNPNAAPGNPPIGWRYAVGTVITLPGCTFAAPAGKTFVEWNTLGNGTGDTYQPGEKLIVPKGGTSLYAIWK